MVLRLLLGVMGIGVLLGGGTPHAHGQKATEMFIPLGQSPGLSYKVTVIGRIAAVSPPARTVTVAGPARTWEAEVTDRTKIWLDRSKLRLPSQKGTFADLRKERLVEVKYEDDGRRGRGPAEWIKVEVTEPGPGLR